MGDKGEGGVKNFKKWVTSFMDSPHMWGILKQVDIYKFREKG